MLELILGGARSGKSRLAEQRAIATNKTLIYIATAEAHDEEMSERIAEHKRRRDEHWQLVEEPVSLAAALRQHSNDNTCILVDCLTLWLSNLLHRGMEHWQRERDELLSVLKELPGDIILVSNEVGHGIVPLGELSRNFVDHSGWLHQDLAEVSDSVLFVIAGLPQVLKSTQD